MNLEKNRAYLTKIIYGSGLVLIILTTNFCSHKKTEENFQPQFYSDIVDSVHKKHHNKFSDTTIKFLFPMALRAIKFDTTNYRNTDFVFESWAGCRDWNFDIERFRQIKNERFGINTVSVCLDEYLRMHGVSNLENRLCPKQKCFPIDNDEFELFVEIIEWLELKYGYKNSWPTFTEVFWLMRTEEWNAIKDKLLHTKKNEMMESSDPIFASCNLKDLERNLRTIRPDDNDCDRAIYSFFCSKDNGELTFNWNIDYFLGYRWELYKIMRDSLYCDRDTIGLLPLTLAFDSTGMLQWAKSANGRYNSKLSRWLQTLNGMHTISFLNRKKLAFEFKVDHWLDVGHWGGVSEIK